MDLTQTKKDIDLYLEGTSSVSTALQDLKGQINIYNQILSDLDHFLELEDLSDADILKLSIARKSNLLERRRHKDYLSVIESILPTQIEGKTTHDRYENAIKNLGQRVYSPRQLTLTEVIGGLS